MWLLASAAHRVGSHYNAGHAWGDHGHGSRGADAAITGSPLAHHGPMAHHSYAQHHPISLIASYRNAPSPGAGGAKRVPTFRVQSRARQRR